MKHFIEIDHMNGQPIRDVCTNLLHQISSYVHESGLFEEPSSCHGIKLIVNPDLSKYNNVYEIGSNIYFTFYNNNIIVNANALNNFKLRCIHLDIKNIQAIKSVLIIVMPSSKNISSNNSEENEDVSNSFEAVAPKFSLEKVVMNNTIKEQINRSIALVKQQKLIFEDWGYKEIDPNTKAIICFYGAPGTGKTMCAHAIAKELGKKIMIASYASIESKWVGEGPKNLRAIFNDALNQDAVLFFDEADSFLSKRVGNAETGSDKHYNRMSNEMFQLLEEYNGIIIFATNLVADFDKAFKSRILSFIEFELPDKATRAEMIRKMLPEKLPLYTPFQNQDFDTLADLSDGFSGREIRKSILTSLSSAALKGQEKVALNNFIDGFKSVKTENSSIEQSMKMENSNREILKDYINEAIVNQSILNVCLYVLWQSEQKIDENTKLELYKYCRYLNIEMPDLTLSHKDADIQDDLSTIVSEKKNVECAKKCCDFLTYISLDANRKIEILSSILTKLEVNVPDFIQLYYNLIKIK